MGYLFHLKSSQAHLLKQFFADISTLIKEVQVFIDSEGIQFNAKDVANNIFFISKLNSDKFEKYEFNASKQIRFGLNLDFISRVIKDVTNNDIIHFRIENESSYQFVLVIESVIETEICIDMLKREKYERFEIELGSPSYNIFFPSKILNNLCRSYKNLGDFITISVNEEKIDFYVQDTSISRKDTLYKNNEDVSFQQNNPEKKLEYSHKFKHFYISNISKFFNISSIVRFIVIDQNTPLIIEYSVSDIGTVKFVLLP